MPLSKDMKENRTASAWYFEVEDRYVVVLLSDAVGGRREIGKPARLRRYG